jgi:energy-coupling factor transporter ATP-binding protein EcfA2
VDVQTEVLIQHALDRLMKGRTSFVIAQRISTVLNADNIIVLDKGRVVAQGKHAESDGIQPDLCGDLPEPVGGRSGGGRAGIVNCQWLIANCQ